MKKTALALALLCAVGCRKQVSMQAPTNALAPVNTMFAQSYADSMSVLGDAVVFFYSKDDAGVLHASGTGFLIAIPSKTKPGIHYTYLVTARHMVDAAWVGCPPSADRLVLRFNKAFKEAHVVLELGAQATVTYPLKEQVWKFDQDGMADIAFTLLPEEDLNRLGAIVRPMWSTNLATKAEADGLRVGDEIVSAGLLSGVSGEWRNYPIFKWGNVSSLRTEPLYVPSQCPGSPPQGMLTTLLAASLVPGNSGSPIVFLPNERHPGRTFIVGVQSVSLLGSDVAGMASIRAMVDTLRGMPDRGDLDLGPPDSPPALAQIP